MTFFTKREILLKGHVFMAMQIFGKSVRADTKREQKITKKENGIRYLNL